MSHDETWSGSVDTRSASERKYATLRDAMVAEQLRSRDIVDIQILAAMSRVPRHEFVSKKYQSTAYDDHPLPIGHGQTISQPYIVALMSQLIRPEPGDRVLEIGTGCGYQSAVLAELVSEVCTIEIIEPLASAARERLTRMGYANIHFRCGDGYQGWRERAPFQGILVTAAPERVPQPLIDQLARGGRMVIPVGGFHQELLLIEKLSDGQLRHTTIAPVAFVPMTGEAQRQ